jgi:hypothetical protein
MKNTDNGQGGKNGKLKPIRRSGSERQAVKNFSVRWRT